MDKNDITNCSGAISDDELTLISQLKENVTDVLPRWLLEKSDENQNLYLVRWIRARENNLEKATEMLRNHLQWRIERNADDALGKIFHPIFTENFGFSCVGADKKGQPVFCVPLTNWDFRKIVNDAQRLVEFEDYMVYLFELTLYHISKEHEKRVVGQSPITQTLFLFDVQNYPYSQLLRYAAVKKILYVGQIYEAHYPEVFYKLIFINCPSYFSLFINLLKPVMPPKTIGKIICHPNMTQWKEDINNFVDPSIIPERYGGTLK